MTIWKYTLEHGHNTFLLPKGAKILHVGQQNGTVCLWARVDPEQEQEKRVFRFVGTGHPLNCTDITYLGTAHDDPFVWHVFEVVE